MHIRCYEGPTGDPSLDEKIAHFIHVVFLEERPPDPSYIESTPKSQNQIITE
jgi:hypothetical protein